MHANALDREDKRAATKAGNVNKLSQGAIPPTCPAKVGRLNWSTRLAVLFLTPAAVLAKVSASTCGRDCSLKTFVASRARIASAWWAASACHCSRHGCAAASAAVDVVVAVVLLLSRVLRCLVLVSCVYDYSCVCCVCVCVSKFQLVFACVVVFFVSFALLVCICVLLVVIVLLLCRLPICLRCCRFIIMFSLVFLCVVVVRCFISCHFSCG